MHTYVNHHSYASFVTDCSLSLEIFYLTYPCSAEIECFSVGSWPGGSMRLRWLQLGKVFRLKRLFWKDSDLQAVCLAWTGIGRFGCRLGGAFCRRLQLAKRCCYKRPPRKPDIDFADQSLFLPSLVDACQLSFYNHRDWDFSDVLHSAEVVNRWDLWAGFAVIHSKDDEYWIEVPATLAGLLWLALHGLNNLANNQSSLSLWTSHTLPVGCPKPQLSSLVSNVGLSCGARVCANQSQPVWGRYWACSSSIGDFSVDSYIPRGSEGLNLCLHWRWSAAASGRWDFLGWGLLAPNQSVVSTPLFSW